MSMSILTTDQLYLLYVCMYRKCETNERMTIAGLRGGGGLIE